MNILNIPFVKLLGISKDKGSLKLEAKDSLHNHIGSTHAGALYTLAETQSGLFLQEQFSDIKVDVMPLLRDSKISYKKPAFGKVKAVASANSEDLTKFKEQFLKKGRASIVVSVELQDSESSTIALGEFKWFVAKAE